MMEEFYEQLVIAEKSSKYVLAQGIMIILAVIAVAAIGVGGSSIISLLGVLLAIIAIVIFFTKRFLYIEYEYLIQQDEIVIDKIFEKSKRKQEISFLISQIEVLGEENNYLVKDRLSGVQKEINAIPDINNDKVYIAVVNIEGTRYSVRFVPNEKFLDICFRKNPRAVKINY